MLSTLEQSGDPRPLRAYDELRASVCTDFDAMEVPGRHLSAALDLFEWLYEQHAPTAQGSAEALTLSRAAALTVRQCLPTLPVNLPAVALSGLLHDIGKPKVGIPLLEKSEAGQEWSQHDTLAMNPHVEHSYKILGAAGFDDDVWRPVAQHHDPQIYGSYSPRFTLDTSQWVTRDCTAVGDSVGAMFTRHNQRNQHLSWNERRTAILPNLQLFFGNPRYGTAGCELAELVLARCEAVILPIAKDRLPEIVFLGRSALEANFAH